MAPACPLPFPAPPPCGSAPAGSGRRWRSSGHALGARGGKGNAQPSAQGGEHRRNSVRQEALNLAARGGGMVEQPQTFLSRQADGQHGIVSRAEEKQWWPPLDHPESVCIICSTRCRRLNARRFEVMSSRKSGGQLYEKTRVAPQANGRVMYASPCHAAARLLSRQHGGCDASSCNAPTPLHPTSKAAHTANSPHTKPTQPSNLAPGAPHTFLRTCPHTSPSHFDSLTSRTTTGFMAGCCSSSWLRRKPALDATLREGSPSLLVSEARRRASPSGLAHRRS